MTARPLTSRLCYATALRAGPDPGDHCGPHGSTKGQASSLPRRHAAPGAKPLTVYGWRGKGHLPALLRRSLELGQYTSAPFTGLADDCQVVLSLGRTGQCWDNALAESFFASLKGELIDLRPWPTRAAARRAIVEYIAWYNGTRLHSTLGYLSPAQFEATANQEATRQVA